MQVADCRPDFCGECRRRDLSDGTGRLGDIEGVWIAPVTAQVMMVLRVSHATATE